ncbi:hypothetical protein M758_1G167900 [Ceratodon purpureus]|nr:hypothetical protein M758_1G167900 [Ceratodon purpureus]
MCAQAFVCCAMPSSQILPLLYVGDEIAAIAPEVHEFKCVLNITEEVPKSALLEEKVVFQRFPIFDVDGGEEEQAQMLSFFPTTCKMIQDNMELNRKVLVHCAEGKQRSCTVVTAYLIQSLGLTLVQAKAYLVAKHPQAFDFGSGLHFEQALERWVRAVRLSSDSASLLKD